MQRLGNKVYLDKLEQKINEIITLYKLNQEPKNQIKFTLRVREIYVLINKIKPRTMEEGKRFMELYHKFEHNLATLSQEKQ